MSKPKPTLGNSFPEGNDELKINEDLNNKKHGPHYDLMQSIQGGTDQVRINKSGQVIGGTTNIGKAKMNW